MAMQSKTRKDRLSKEEELRTPRRMEIIYFSVDSALLRELGERLVGRPHIALAELVKNSFDADATKVIIRFGPDSIEIIDNGHGMDFQEFRDFWMRIGSPHKEKQRLSRYLRRPMTGSKGVGRLAVQFLARKLELRTVSKKGLDSELEAYVDWGEAVEAGELTRAQAHYRQVSTVTSFPAGSPCGTLIILHRLNQEWASQEIVDLARAIWWLQPPFRSHPDLTSDAQKAFAVELESPDKHVAEDFKRQMRAYLDLWHARMVGKLLEASDRGRSQERKVRLSFGFYGEKPITIDYSIEECRLHGVEFEIRVYHLERRQRHGIKVREAREYLKEYGGVHVYDTGFHLPYYGPDTDWLRIEMDHSHRLSRSQLLPPELQISEGLSYLPTNSRLLGVVHVNTSKEREAARRDRRTVNGDYLKLQVTRDRLVDNWAFKDLQKLVRWALDFYTMQEAKRKLDERDASRKVEPVREKFARVDQVLVQYREKIPEDVYNKVRIETQEAIKASESEAEAVASQVGLLGALATAGISAMAYEHEVGQQFQLLDSISDQLKKITVSDQVTHRRLGEIAEQLKEWNERARATRALFSHLMDEENREKKGRFKARPLFDAVRAQMDVLMRGVNVDMSGIDDSLRLPEGAFAEWSAIFQNIFVNSVNALLDAQMKQIAVCSQAHGKMRALLIQDTGCGVDLSTADDLFKPFERRLKISPERRSLGLGGSGLGLTIVRMIANRLGCKVAFVEPDDGFNTAFQLSWSESK